MASVPLARRGVCGVVLAVLVLGAFLVLFAVRPPGPRTTPVPPAVPGTPAVQALTAEPPPPKNRPIDPFKGRLLRVLQDFIGYLQSEATLSGAEKTRILLAGLQEARSVLREADKDSRDNLSPFKFPVRGMAERLGALDPEAFARDLGGEFSERGYRASGESDRWAFDPLEEAVYRLVLHDPDFVEPAWAMQILRWEAVGNQDPLDEVIHRSPPDQYTRADLVRQLFTGNTSSRSGARQMARALQVVDRPSLEGCVWAELGYGSGQIFGAVRERVGPQGRLVGVELGSGYEDFVHRITRRHLHEWGEVTLVRGTEKDCRLPADSVDIAHEAGIHVGVGTPATLEQVTIPWLLSVRRALRPGGLIILDDCGYPTIDGVRAVMQRAGFEEVRMKLMGGHAAGGQHPDFVVSYRRPGVPGPPQGRAGSFPGGLPVVSRGCPGNSRT